MNSQVSTREELTDNLRDALGGRPFEVNRELAAALPQPGAYEEVSLAPLKRRDLLDHLQLHGCGLVREGRRHS